MEPDQPKNRLARRCEIEPTGESSASTILADTPVSREIARHLFYRECSWPPSWIGLPPLFKLRANAKMPNAFDICSSPFTKLCASTRSECIMLFDISFILNDTLQDTGAISSATQQSGSNIPVWSPSDDSNLSYPILSASALHSPFVLGTTISSIRSSSIPLPSSHVTRTHSELQLSLDEEVAERRDANMFYRLVNGIRERHAGPLGDIHLDFPEKNTTSIVSTEPTSDAQEDSSSAEDSSDTQQWQTLHSTQERVSEGTSNDEWSITGYEAQLERPGNPCNCNLDSPGSLHRGTEEEEEEEPQDDDEGVFSLDL